MSPNGGSPMLDRRAEVEMKLLGRFKVSPQIAGAIKAVPGAVDVQTLSVVAVFSLNVQRTGKPIAFLDNLRFCGTETQAQLQPFRALATKGWGMDFGARSVLAWGGVTDFGLAVVRL